jgi:DNA repair photolyase
MSGSVAPHGGSEREYRDAPVQGPVRGRGAGLNPGNRFEDVRLHILGEHLDEIITENPDGTQVRTRVFEDATRTIVNPVDSPDICFKWTINPYRGCEHGCIYCYARPSHELLGLSSGLDFETRIYAKKDAAALLRRKLASPGWKAETIVMSGITDPYQPVEAKLGITRSIVEVLAECRQPVGFITKNKLITRDLDLLQELNRFGAVSAAVSITTLDHDLAMKMEPRAGSPKARLEAVSKLASAGIPVRVMMAPIVPGLTDHEIPAVLKACADAGAMQAGYVMLRLPHQIKALFLDWLERLHPGKAARIEGLIRDVRGGKLYDSKWFTRGKGEGPMADQINQTFKVFRARYGLDRDIPELSGEAFRPPVVDGQMPLFGT